jgi:tRNA threonylcarbamoyladenosine modification (KEOPS) complex Cgi121 subunit
MFLSRISSKIDKKVLLELAVKNELLLLDPKKVRSLQSLHLAEHLAKTTVSEGTNISKRLHLEFLLWLAGRKDISRALDDMLFADARDMLVISFKRCRKLIDEITDKKLELDLEKEASPAELESISLSRISN